MCIGPHSSAARLCVYSADRFPGPVNRELSYGLTMVETVRTAFGYTLFTDLHRSSGACGRLFSIPSEMLLLIKVIRLV